LSRLLSGREVDGAARELDMTFKPTIDDVSRPKP
jgi:hypothetical protein